MSLRAQDVRRHWVLRRGAAQVAGGTRSPTGAAAVGERLRSEPGSEQLTERLDDVTVPTGRVESPWGLDSDLTHTAA